MKKIYISPKMDVVEIKNQPALLAGSFDDQLNTTGGDGSNALAPELEFEELDGLEY